MLMDISEARLTHYLIQKFTGKVQFFFRLPGPVVPFFSITNRPLLYGGPVRGGRGA